MNPAEGSRVVDLPKFHELRPTQDVVDALRGRIEPVDFVRQIPEQENPQQFSVLLSVEGPGMFGLTDWRDNKLWAGIFNHSILSARYSLYFAAELIKRGHKVNSQQILDGMIVSHSGRRQWDEAGLYPEAAEDAQGKRKISNELLGLTFIHGKVPPDVFNLVAALAHENDKFPVSQEVLDSLEYRITEYVDHRTTHIYQPLFTRMGDFLLDKFFKKEVIASDPDLKRRVRDFTSGIIERRKAFYLKKSKQGITIEQADQEAEDLGASVDSDRLKRIDLIKLILNDADTEALLEKEGINTDGLSDETVPMTHWEQDLRKSYVESARPSIRIAIDTGELKIDPNNANWWEKLAFIAAANEKYYLSN